MHRRHHPIGIRNPVQMLLQFHKHLVQKRLIASAEFYVNAVVPSGEQFDHVGRNIVRPREQIGELRMPLRHARRNFSFVKPPRNSQLRLRERIVVPSERSHDRRISKSERLIGQPMPPGLPAAAGEFLVQYRITVRAICPQFVISRHQQFRPLKLEQRKTLFEVLAIRDCRIPDHKQNIRLTRGVHTLDQVNRLPVGPDVIEMKIGGNQDAHAMGQINRFRLDCRVHRAGFGNSLRAESLRL